MKILLVPSTLAITLFVLSGCLIQEHTERRAHSHPNSSDIFANNNIREFLFDVGGRQDIEETFILENSQQEQIIRMKSVYLEQTLRFQQTERAVISEDKSPKKSHSEKLIVDANLSVQTSFPPLADSLEIRNEDTLIEDFSLSDSNLDFSDNEDVAAGDELTLSYDYITKNYQLESEPAPGTLQVFVNETLIMPDLYTVQGQELALSFLPPASSTVRFQYRNHLPLISSQPLGSLAIVPDSIVVSYDQLTVPDSFFSYQSSNNTIMLHEIPGDGVEVAIAYRFKERDEYNYELMKKPSSTRRVKVFDWETREEVTFNSISNYTISFDAMDFVEGRELVAIYKGEDNIKQDIRLTHEPIEGSFSSNFQKSICLSGTGLKQDGRHISLDCELEGRSELRFAYTFLTKRTRFPINSVTNPEYGVWEVYIDGKKTADWRREGNVIIIPENLPEESKVLIRYIKSLPPKNRG